MPQMAPHNWLLLMIMLNLIMYFFNCNIYFYSTYKNNKIKNYSKKKISWKW